MVLGLPDGRGGKMTRAGWRWPFVVAHTVLWGVLASILFERASHSPSASCWQLALIYIPGLNILLIAVPVVSLGMLALSVFDLRLRSGWPFFAALNGAIISVGMAACIASAYASPGPVYCL